MSSRIIERDRGARALLERLEDAKGQIRVGVLGSKPHDNGSGQTVADIARYHEFGTDTIPERSFIRSTADKKKKEIEDLKREVARGVARGKFPMSKGIGMIGEEIVAKMQKTITDKIPPPLKAATERRKKSSTPLVDTGQLRQSITWEPNLD